MYAMEDFELGECAGCGEVVSETNYRYDSEWEMFLCTKCEGDTGTTEITIIDRLTRSTETNPLIWPCYYCEKLMGGGHKWRLVKQITKFSSYDLCDICDDCFAARGITDVPMIVEKSPRHKFYKNPNPLLGEPDFELTTPDVKTFGTLSEDAIRRVNCNDFGYMSQWKYLSNWYEIPHYPAGTAMIIDCKAPYRVCSLAYDDHGRVSIDLVYNTFEEYAAALSLWKPPVDVDESMEKLKKLVNDRTYEIDTQCYIDVCTEFSAYIRLSKDLPVYFG